MRNQEFLLQNITEQQRTSHNKIRGSNELTS